MNILATSRAQGSSRTALRRYRAGQDRPGKDAPTRQGPTLAFAAGVVHGGSIQITGIVELRRLHVLAQGVLSSDPRLEYLYKLTREIRSRDGSIPLVVLLVFTN